MAYLVELSQFAETEARQAFEWKREYSTESAIRWYSELLIAVRSLQEQPKRCTLAPENDHFQEEVRHLIFGKRTNAYRIIFVIRGVTVFVLSIRHGAQQHFSMPSAEEDET